LNDGSKRVPNSLLNGVIANMPTNDGSTTFIKEVDRLFDGERRNIGEIRLRPRLRFI